jgi:hypothetical protein
MPEGVQADQLKSSYSASGILTIEAPRVLTVPEGATVQEAMAAKSKAFTTDDGKTNVKEDSQASSQVIAATTESPDGKTKSSMSYSSSNTSSSSMMTSSGGKAFDMPGKRFREWEREYSDTASAIKAPKLQVNVSSRSRLFPIPHCTR